jgi:hypothetical protein
MPGEVNWHGASGSTPLWETVASAATGSWGLVDKHTTVWKWTAMVAGDGGKVKGEGVRK